MITMVLALLALLVLLCFVGLVMYARKPMPQRRSIRWFDILLLWPLLIDSRRDSKTGAFKLRRMEIVGIVVVLLLILYGIITDPGRVH
jgi:hypothetical protein